MKATVFRLNEPGLMPLVASRICFARYLMLVQQEASATEGITRRLLQYIIKTFDRNPDYSLPFLEAEGVLNHPELLELVQSTVYPLLGGHQRGYFALGTPFTGELFYLSNALHNLFTLQEAGFFQWQTSALFSEENQQILEKQFYQLVLERFYNVVANTRNDIVFIARENEQGLPRYIRQETDLRFAEVKTTKPLPDLPDTFIALARKNQLEAGMLKQWLPLSLFELEGFAIHRFHDVTSAHALDTIKNLLLFVNDYTDTEMYDSLQESLRLIIQHAPMRIGLLPLLQVNRRYVYHEQVVRSSLIANDEPGIAARRFEHMADWASYGNNPIIFQNLTTETNPDYKLLTEGLEEKGFRSYLFVPLWYSDKPVGILELATPEPGFFTQETALDLSPALDLVAQIMRHSIENFEDSLDAVIKSHFTSLQPTIEWRFNEAAWNYLMQTVKGSSGPIEEIYFEQVLPFYGAIDIRNSSQQRNLALQQDYMTHLELLRQKLHTLQEQFAIEYIEEKLSECLYWIRNVQDDLTADEELDVRNFFDRNILPFLRQVSLDHPNTKAVIDSYFQTVHSNSSDVYRFSQDFDDSQGLITQSMIRYFDTEKRKLEKKYPVYFERSRTDGLEYNLYAGASIAPQLHWVPTMADELRYWQLQGMTEVAALTHQLVPALKVPLQTTQLIIAFGQTISIHFRRDEKKFDVEGAYSVGFEIMKKRIDKALIKDTGERLTKPGTIAIVYTSHREIAAWEKGIQQLQEAGKLATHIETLALTDVQGIAGLKAWRLTILVESF